MNEPLTGVEVIFVKDIRPEDATAVIKVIRGLKGVLTLNPIVFDPDREKRVEGARQKLAEIQRRINHLFNITK